MLSKGDDKKSISKPIVRIAVGGIIIGTVVMILTLAIVKGFQSEIRNKMIGFNGHIIVSKYDNDNSIEPNPIVNDAALYERIKKNMEVSHIQIFAYKNGIIKTKTENEGVVLKGVGTDYNWSFLQSNLLKGKLPELKKDSISDKILLSNKQSKRLGLNIGDRMIVYFVNKKKIDSLNYSYEQRARQFYICGIYETGLEELDANTSFIDIRHIQRLNYWNENEVAGYEISIKNLSKLDELTNEINDQCGMNLIAESVKSKNQAIFGWLELIDSNAVIIITLMIAVAGINMISALLIMILEKTRSIGILKALGASNSFIRSIFLNQALYLIGRGLLIGNAIGIILCLAQVKFQLIGLDQESYYLTHVPILLNWEDLILLNVFTIFSCTLMMLLPTMVISKITPVKAIRFS